MSSARSRWWRGAALALLAATFVALLPPRPGAAARQPPRIGIFGDSISAGEGLPDIQPGEEGWNGCQRALGRDGRSTAWGVQVEWEVERRLGVGRSWFAACTGAQTEHFARETQRDNGRNEPQLQEARAGLGKGAFDVVLATFGMNDMASMEHLFRIPGLIKGPSGMTALVANCVGADEFAVDLLTGNKVGATTILFGGWIGLSNARCRPNLDASVRKHLDATVRGELRVLYEEIYNATTAGGLIVLPGYPQIFSHPDSWPLYNRVTRRCQLMHRDDVHIIRGLLPRLNEIIEDEVDLAERLHPDRQWVYVDVVPTFDDNGLCSPNGRQWLNGFPMLPRIQQSYHPTQEGQDAYNGVVIADGEVDSWIAAYGAVTSPTISPPQSNGSSLSNTSIVIDVSSSMGEDAGGEVKIDAAKRAASDVLTLLKPIPGIEFKAGLVQFSTDAEQVAPLGTGVATVASFVDGLVPDGSTNLGAGLELGIDQVVGAPGDKAVVLLSDGATNVGMSREDILRTVVPKATTAGVKVYTVGFGSSASEFDEDLLRQIATRTGGDYGAAQAIGGLRRLFQQSHYNSIGTVIADLNGAVSQGQVVNAGNFVVGPLKAQLHVALSWPGSDLDPMLVDPKGKIVDAKYKGVEFFRDQNPEVVVVERPKKGEWTLKVKGKDVSQPEEEFFAIAATRGVIAAEPGASILLPLLAGGGGLGLGGAGGGYAVFRARRRRRATCLRCGAPHDGRRPCGNCGRVAMASLALMVLDGPQAGQVLQLRPGDVLGRGETATHALPDDTVSRNHAEIAWAEGQWAIYDLGSSSGTYRNREPIVQAHLTVGDVITLGSTNLRVEGTTA